MSKYNDSAADALKKFRNEIQPEPACSATGITIPIHEYSRLKDIETRFKIIRDQMLHAEYCPIHTQIILGIEKEYKNHDEFVIPPFMKRNFNIPEEKREEIFFDDGK